MTLIRPVQNFSQRRGCIASLDGRALETLSVTLPRLGLEVQHLVLDDTGRLPEFDVARDILFVDGDLSMLRHISFGGPGCHPPVPVIGLVGVEAPSRLRALMEVGATAFLSKPVHAGTVFSSLYLGVNEYARRSAYLAAIDELESRRRRRRHVIKAVTHTMRMNRIDDDAAFALLRRESMRSRVSLETYCEYVVQRSTAKHDRGELFRDCEESGKALIAGRQAIAD
ncbi:ANTAR domain-containing protein [Aureimonas fodinaquatilis]|uniref:ANTAR domain-containing protein n=1 Tax=Aureimonas fodinaquatilis TaxID=2565783 RepID=A0A5B0DWM1_9HYPH|nr:ANTAR domain-containing protein [Aureimonas fodinaquatilis]KAA0969599.1 ANTAR domain-containing protein [Aureimonas fodinaquatilis]